MCVSILSACMLWIMCVPGIQGGQRGHQIPLELELRMVWTTVWVVGTKLESSAGTSVLHPLASPQYQYFSKPSKEDSLYNAWHYIEMFCLCVSFIHSLTLSRSKISRKGFQLSPSQNPLSLFPSDLGIYRVPLAFWK